MPGDDGEVPRLLVLLIRHTHIRLEHAGVRDTLAELRGTVWILRGRQIVKKVLKKCVQCNRVIRQHFEQPVAPLPAARCSKNAPFQVTGVDYAGPLYVRDGRGKAWFIVFTCGTMRAIHIEMVTDMTTQSFIMAYDRFINRRGVPSIIYSDNAKTFQAADRKLKEIYRTARDRLANDGVEWRFIAEGAPWWGGFWERMVRSVKAALKKTIGRALLTEQELRTALVKIEGVLNSRPVSYQPSDHREPRPVSPSDILIGRRITALPSTQPDPVVREYSHTDVTNRLRYVDKLTADFFERFKKDYLKEQALHYERRRQVRDVQLGEVVLIAADNVKRQEWIMGVVIEVFPSVDGVARSVRLRTSNGVLRRPVQRLCALELKEDDEERLPYPAIVPQDGNADPDVEPVPEEVVIDDEHAQLNLDPEPEPEIDPVEPDGQPDPDPVPDARPEEPIAVQDPVENQAADLQDRAVPQRGSVEDFTQRRTRSGREVRLPARFRD